MPLSVKPALLACSLFVYAASLSAAPTSYVIAEVGSDEFDNRDYYFASDLGGERGPHVQLEYGEGEQTDSSGTSVTESSRIGITSNPFRPVSIGISRANWTRDNAIDIDSTRLSLSINTDDWSFSLSPEQRDITMAVSTTTTTPMSMSTGSSSITFDSNGIGGSVGYYGFYPVSVSLYHVRYDYPGRLSNLADRFLLASRFFSSATLDQAFALEDRRTSISASYSVSNFVLGVNLSRSTAAIDQSDSVTQLLYAEYDLNAYWFVGASIGRTSDDISDDSTLFGSASIGYQW